MMEVDAALTHDSIVRAEGLTASFRGESRDQLRIRMKFFFAAMQLLFAAVHHIGSPLNGVDRSANLDGLTDQALQAPSGAFVLIGTEKEEVAIGVGSLRATHIQKMGSISRVHDAVYVGFDTDILVDMLECLVGGDASMFCPCG